MAKIPDSIETMRPEAAKMLERFYGPLVKQLNLAPEPSEKLYQILLDQKMHGLAQMTELLRHSDPARMSREVADFQKETDARVQTLLGDAHFAQYREYQAGIGDRGFLELMKNDFAEHPLTEEQQQNLLKTMASGRQALTGATGHTDAGPGIADSVEVMEQKLKRQESLDTRILQTAAGFLSPAQLQILGSAQTRFRTWRKNGHAKGQAMFGDRGSSGENQS